MHAPFIPDSPSEFRYAIAVTSTKRLLPETNVDEIALKRITAVREIRRESIVSAPPIKSAATLATEFFVSFAHHISKKFTVQRYPISLKCIERERRIVILDPRELLHAFFKSEALLLPGMARLQSLMEEVERHNQAPQTPLPSGLDEIHSEIRHLLFYYQCVAFTKTTTKERDTEWKGAKVQLHTGTGYLQAAHHALLPHVQDGCISSLKLEFEKQLRQAVNGVFPLQNTLVIQLLSLGVDPKNLLQEYCAAFKGTKSIPEALRTIFSDLRKAGNLIDEDCLFYYINNHTVIAPAPLNLLDALLEVDLRPEARNLLNQVAVGRMTPHEAAKSLTPRYAEIATDLRDLEQSMKPLGWAVRAYMDTCMGSYTTLGEKTQVLQRYLQKLKEIEVHFEAINKNTKLTRTFNIIYQNHNWDQPIVSKESLEKVQKLIHECERFLKDVKSLSTLKKEIEEYQFEIDQIRKVSEDRTTGIEENKKRLQQVIPYLQKDPKAREFYDKYQARIHTFQTQENLAQETINELEKLKIKAQNDLNNAEVSAQRFEHLAKDILESGNPLQYYLSFSDTTVVSQVLSFVEPQKRGTERAQMVIEGLPKDYEALQAYLISRNVSVQYKKD